MRSRSGIYHVILRGANKQEIFHDEADKIHFLNIIVKCKNKTSIQVFAWCLMDNHVHLVIKEDAEDISHVMKRIGVSYAGYYNRTYETTGHLFQDRFRSEEVEDPRYLMRVVRYIHQNPVKAGIVNSPDKFEWSSCRNYYGKSVHHRKLLDEGFVLHLFSSDHEMSRKAFREFNEKEQEDECLKAFNHRKVRLSDAEARESIIQILGTTSIPQVKSMERKERDLILRKVKEVEGVSMRQTARILGVSLSLLSRA
ncbi:transposase [Halobacillus litoralis]|uniref:transposase n=1 Tax=Halobacillus litoralis TaxID=45668 RepID=UPI001CD39CDC|nr:transposase [Halobacillus litoralis]MCA0971430.1 transposase [Halobacillus litoralis]